MGFPSYLAEAQRLLESSGASHPPVKLSDVVARCQDIKVSFDDIEGDGYLVDLGGLGSQVMLKKASPKVRQRFTLAHEIGHWILNKNIDIKTAHGNDLIVEEWCNHFAAELLMPSEWVRKCVLDLSLSNFWRILEFPKMFYVSAEAFYRKVPQATPVSTFFITESTKRGKKITQHKSEECTESLLTYMTKWESAMLGEKLKGEIKVAENLFCFYMLMHSNADSKEYVVFLVPSEDGLTIKCSRRSKLRG